MPYFLSDFLKQHAGIELVLDVTNNLKVIRSLERNEVDFALVSVMPDHLKIEKVDLFQNKLYLVSNRDLSSQVKFMIKVFLSLCR